MSKFDGLISAKSRQTATSGIQTKETTVSGQKTGKSRLPGKRSDPNFTQITAYIRKETHENVMRKIYKQKEFSELLEELLTDWMKKS